MENYRFGDFMLCGGQILYHNELLVNIPPKEIAVLTLLIENAGKILFKEDIINKVWAGGEVSDESLTRCVYVLRRLLGDGPSSRYIDTVYGKGYRFVMPVTTIESDREETTSSGEQAIAIYPFVMKDHDTSHAIFDYIISHGDIFQDSGFRLMPAAMTVNSHHFSNTFDVLRLSGADFYLTGMEVRTCQETVVRIELIRSDILAVVARDSVLLSSDLTLDLINFRHVIAALLKSVSGGQSNVLARSVVDIKNKGSISNNLQKEASVFQFEQFRTDDNNAVDLRNYEAGTLCNLAGCYQSLAFLDVMSLEKAEEIIEIITDRVLSLEPQNAQALSMKALMSGAAGVRKSETDFHLAMILAPLSADVYYYYACYMVRQRDLSKALQVVRMSLSLRSDFFAARVLEMVILARNGELEQAIQDALAMTGLDEPSDIILHCLLCLFYERNGNRTSALHHLRQVKVWRDRCAFVSCVYNSVMKNASETNNVLNKLTGMSASPVFENACYWLPFIDAGSS